jgi:hypothetical protein
MGEFGPNSENVLQYFATVSGESPPDSCNPAEFCLATISKMEPAEAEAAFRKSERSEHLK